MCGGAVQRTFAAGYDYELATCPNRWTFRECGRCGHVQLDPRPAPQSLSAIYPPHYYSYNMDKRLARWVMWGKSVLDGRRLAAIFGSLGRPARTYLDAGCGDGKYLERKRRDGMPPECLYGIELDEAAVARGTARGFKVHRSTIEDCKEIPEGGMDVITLFHVIEHLPDPASAVRKLASWLSPGGVLAIETPNRNAPDARWFRRTYWGGYHIPRHWHLFDEAGLERLLTGQGLVIEKRRYVSGHSFWLYSFHHALAYNRYWRLPGLAKRFDPMRSKLALLVVTAFDYARAALGMRTSSVLVIARKP